tara:strand:- start:1939 stop:2535 length:597 start_codon:yes stop_codon:yes gene_type:complete
MSDFFDIELEDIPNSSPPNAAELALYSSEPTNGPPADGRRNEDGSRVYEVKELHARQQAIARLSALGLSGKDIAEMVGCTPQTVSNSLNSAIVKNHVSELNSMRDQHVIDQAKELTDLTPKAIQELKDGFNDDSGLSAMQRVKLAQDVLDRTGHGRTTKIQAETIHAHMTLSDIADIKNLANAHATRAGNLIEAEVSS